MQFREIKRLVAAEDESLVLRLRGQFVPPAPNLQVDVCNAPSLTRQRLLLCLESRTLLHLLTLRPAAQLVLWSGVRGTLGVI